MFPTWPPSPPGIEPPSMPTLVALLSFLGVFSALGWLTFLGHLILHRDQAVFLADLPDAPPPQGWPTLAVAFAARDEAGGVEAATRSMLAQDYPGLEVIAVDDRSVDATGAILDAIEGENPRLRVVHVRDLPAGWLGKTHALQRASEATEARWLLLTDADVIFEPGALKRAVGFAEANGLGHLTLGPGVPTESAGERLFLGLFGLLFAIGAPLGKVADMKSKASVGIGAFNLVRLESFRAIGGFGHLALSVDDDMRLGQAMKFAGYRPRLLLGNGAVSVRWQVGLGGMIRGLEKNFYAASGFRPALAALGGCLIAVVGLAPFVGLFVGPMATRVVCGLGIAALVALFAGTNRQSGIPWYYAFAVPLATVALLAALIRSVVLTLARDGVIWRGHYYHLAELKRHVRLRDAWTREVWKSTR